MELNNDDRKCDSNHNSKSVKSQLNNAIEDLKNLNNTIISSLSESPQKSEFIKEIKLKITNSLYETHSYKFQYKILKEIITNIEKYIEYIRY